MFHHIPEDCYLDFASFCDAESISAVMLNEVFFRSDMATILSILSRFLNGQIKIKSSTN